MQALIRTFHPLSKIEEEKLKEKLSFLTKEKEVSLRVQIDESLLGGLVIQFESTLIDLSLKEKLKKLKEQFKNYPLDKVDIDEFPDFVKKIVDFYQQKTFVFEIGRIESVKDGVAHILGMQEVRSNEMLEFEGGQEGLVLNLTREGVDALILSGGDHLKEGSLVYQTDKVMRTPVSSNMWGRVLNSLGKPIDGKGMIEEVNFVEIEQPAPALIDRASVQIPFQTGVKMIDALVPIGRGQRELIIGDRQTGKTSLITDMILSQKENNLNATSDREKIFCIYVAIGQKNGTVARFVKALEEKGALDYTLVVNASASQNAVLQYLAPYTGCAIAEYFRDKGLHVVIFYDDLSKHAVAYREISLLLRRFPGREAYPGDIFFIHSRLLERAAMLCQEKQGGSLTAIPVVETQENDVSAYIPTNIISITDGQIFLDSDLFKKGFRPAVDVRLSVSRVGGAAQIPAMKKLSAPLRLDLSRYWEVMSFSQFSSHMDDSSKKLIDKGNRLREILKQKNEDVLDFPSQVILLFAGLNGFLETLSLEEVPLFQRFILDRIPIGAVSIYKALEKEKDLSDETSQKLKNFLGTLLEEFKKQQGEA